MASIRFSMLPSPAFTTDMNSARRGACSMAMFRASILAASFATFPLGSCTVPV